MATETPHHLFVYGTLRSEFDNEFACALRLIGESVGQGRIAGRLHAFDGFPGSIFSGNGAVHGEVFRLPEDVQESLLGLIDAYENFDPSDAEGSLFRREEVRVTLSTGEEIVAWAFEFNRDPLDAPAVDGGDWIAHLRRGVSGSPPPGDVESGGAGS